MPPRFDDYVDGKNLLAAEYREPQSFKDATESDDAEKWAKAMDEEFSALQKNEVLEHVQAPKNRRPIDCN